MTYYLEAEDRDGKRGALPFASLQLAQRVALYEGTPLWVDWWDLGYGSCCPECFHPRDADDGDIIKLLDSGDWLSYYGTAYWWVFEIECPRCGLHYEFETST